MTKLKRVLDGIVDTRRHHVYEAAQRVLNRIPMERARALQFEWLMVPFILVIFSALPALHAQTRLMLGKYLEFWVTDKHRSK